MTNATFIHSGSKLICHECILIRAHSSCYIAILQHPQGYMWKLWMSTGDTIAACMLITHAHINILAWFLLVLHWAMSKGPEKRSSPLAQALKEVDCFSFIAPLCVACLQLAPSQTQHNFHQMHLYHCHQHVRSTVLQSCSWAMWVIIESSSYTTVRHSLSHYIPGGVGR